MELTSTDCPCGTGKDFERCCGPFHNREAYATTPEELMRARYSAFCLRNVDYYLSTIHQNVRFITDPETFYGFCDRVKMKGLQVKSSSADSKGLGRVLFEAWFVENGKLDCIHEHSNFVFIKERWYYVNGKRLPKPEVKRNDVCICGSGSKFKKCCGR